ncbi:subtype B tannase [Streptomyces sp. RTd22]|uniref:subtype B tannase n=1 Tax=Streptomyces sp. RTd22 TaxID=1841249 RepID=UPI001F394413|nr:subtype B tannase [Streptomyces sp. RTd22]
MSVKRRTMIMGLAAATAAASTAGVGVAAAARSRKPSDALVFDKDAYTVLTTTVATDDGDKAVTYHFYKALTYVTNPVDAKYQCLNVSVPVEIDGTAVDATRAPILFANSVGGYMPSSVADATGVGGSPMTPPGGGGGGGGGGGQAAMVSNAKLAVAAGYVVVEPGARGRTLVDADGTYYGTAPTAIVDLKAAVRYVRFNKGRIPGNTDRIVSSGTSAGGALSALLGASGDSPLYETDLRELGAAPASDAIFAGGAWCPIADLEHADMAYEWNWGGNKLSSGDTVDPTVSKELRSAFAEYQAALKLRGKHGFGPLTARTYDDYLVKTYLAPAATTHLKALPAADRSDYLAKNPWLTWSGDRAAFAWSDFLTHVGARKKNTPAFDPFDLSAPENNLFGTGTTQARHFTLYSLRHATGNDSARLDGDLPRKLDLMNPMFFIEQRNPGRAKHWWIRVGTKDTDTSLTVVGNLAAGLENLGDDVDALMYWDAGHGANEDAADFMTWIGRVTGYSR